MTRDSQAGFAGHYAFDIHHPRLGWAVQPNIRDMPVFDGKVLNSNSRGLRGRSNARPERGCRTMRPASSRQRGLAHRE